MRRRINIGTVKKGLLVLSFLSFASCALWKPVPQPEREFRGFWVATVVNIDWPKKGTDAIEKKKADYRTILNFYQDLNFNAAIVQVRTAGDAFYTSDYAPWSRFLTGKEGKTPDTQENLLQWMIDETHDRGMEFHAWLNPYRATFDLKTDILSTAHDFNQHPEWMLKYGKKYYYDPGLPQVQERMISVIDELVSIYDIDAVHFDDYFYPYTIKDEVFNDSITYYNCSLPNQDLGDWRRSNIDSLIKKSHATIKARKPWVQFGVSPFGVWKNQSTDPKGSDTQAGQTTFDNLYADPLLWMEQGWLDYIVPQVYWSMELPVASHRKIVNWWSQYSTNTLLYIGNGPYKIRNNSDTAWNKKKELPDQIHLARNTDEVNGNVFFSAKSLMTNSKDVVKHLKRKFYRKKALPPQLQKTRVVKEQKTALKSIQNQKEHTLLEFDHLEQVHYATIYTCQKVKKDHYVRKKLLKRSFVKNKDHIRIPSDLLKGKKRIAIIFMDKNGRESEPKIIHLKQTDSNDPKE